MREIYNERDRQYERYIKRQLKRGIMRERESL